MPDLPFLLENTMTMLSIRPLLAVGCLLAAAAAYGAGQATPATPATAATPATPATPAAAAMPATPATPARRSRADVKAEAAAANNAHRSTFDQSMDQYQQDPATSKIGKRKAKAAADKAAKAAKAEGAAKPAAN